MTRIRNIVTASLVVGVTLVVGWHVAPRAAAAAVLVVAVAAGMYLVHRFSGTAHTVSRWGARTRRRSGVATRLDIVRVASGWAMRRKAAAVRPSLAALTRRDRRRLATQQVAVKLCRVAQFTVWASLEDVVLLFGGPRVGKTGWLGGAVIDAPGAVLTTSTRTDLLDLTRTHRAAGGRSVWVFNPGGLAGLESTVVFDPLTGCAEPTTATERAADMIPEADGDGDRSYWDGQARRVLAALMHAAALDPTGSRGMRDVLRWTANPDEARREILALLDLSPEAAYVQDVAQWVDTNDKTRSSITSTMMPALGWLTSASARAATRGGQPFDVAELIRSRGTVYLLGRHEAHTAPLLAALTGYVAREARRLAAYQPGGRLDPPLTLALDEAARVAPVPLPDWSGDAGGSGLQLIGAFQSRADLINRWGTTGAATILNNAGSVVLFGGTKDAADLDVWSKLAGDRDEPVITRDGSGKVTSRSVRKTPVLSPAQLANLPAGRAVVFSRGMPPVVGRVEKVWERRDVRAATRAARRVGVTHSAPTPTPATYMAPTHPQREATHATH
jgi:type IV secretion system protein VirD4